MNPDHISEYSRGMRQQSHYYNPETWTASLNGQGIKRAANTADEEGGTTKRPSAKQIQAWNEAKQKKKRAKLMQFVA